MVVIANSNHFKMLVYSWSEYVVQAKQYFFQRLVSSTHILQGIFPLGIRGNYTRPGQ